MMRTNDPRWQPLVSIIVSSYNYDAFLRDAIDSALGQTYKNIEVIVVDDGSKDTSPQIIAEYGNKIISILKANGGQASSMNAGFQSSNGEIIIFLDSDDIIYPEAVESIIPFFKDRSVSKVHWLLDEINIEGKKTNKIVPKFKLAQGNVLKELIIHGPEKCGGPPYSPPTSGNAWSREFINSIMPIPEELYTSNTDKYLQFLAPVYGEMRAIERSLGGYRVHGGNYSLHPIRDYAGEYLDRFEKTCQIVEEHLKKKGIEVNTTEWSRNTWFHEIMAGIQDIVNIVPENRSFVLVDEDAWGIGQQFENRKRFHFLDKDGQYNGPPQNDAKAIDEMERMRKENVDYIFFTSNTFWWLDHFDGFASFLKNNAQLILKNARLIVFKLHNQ